MKEATDVLPAIACVILSVAALILVAGWAIRAYRDKSSKPIRFPWSKNILSLMGMGYGLILAILLGLTATEDMTLKDAYIIIQGPLMALIGGSIAICQELLHPIHTKLFVPGYREKHDVELTIK